MCRRGPRKTISHRTRTHVGNATAKSVGRRPVRRGTKLFGLPRSRTPGRVESSSSKSHVSEDLPRQRGSCTDEEEKRTRGQSTHERWRDQERRRTSKLSPSRPPRCAMWRPWTLVPSAVNAAVSIADAGSFVRCANPNNTLITLPHWKPLGRAQRAPNMNCLGQPQ